MIEEDHLMADSNLIKDELSEYPFNPEEANAEITLEFSDQEHIDRLQVMADERGITMDHLVNAMLFVMVKEQKEKERQDDQCVDTPT